MMANKRRSLLMFIWIVSTAKYISTSYLNDCAKQVEKCPVSESNWRQKNQMMNCTSNFGYVCMRDSIGQLYELCMENFTVTANLSKCPVLTACVNSKALLGPISGYYPCPEELAGCPPKHNKEYRIFNLYKYPRCIESSTSYLHGNISMDTASNITTTIWPDQANKKSDDNIIVLMLVAFHIAAVAIIITCGGVLWKKKYGGYRQMRNRDNRFQADGNTEIMLQDITILSDSAGEIRVSDLREKIRDCNENESSRVQIPPLKPNDTADIEKIYIPILISNENDIIRNQPSDNTNINYVKLENIFHNQQGEPARFVFMLGDAGYGKTLQCQKIAKSWCKAWGNKNQVTDLEKRMKKFGFLFFVKMRHSHGKTNLIDIIQDAYSCFRLPLTYIDAIGEILKNVCYRSLVLLDGLDEWDITKDTSKDLKDTYLPNCRDLPNCTILVTMRSWKFMDIQNLRRYPADVSVRLHGFDENGFESLTEYLLCHYYNLKNRTKQFRIKKKEIQDATSFFSNAVTSLTKVPLFAVFCIMTLYDNTKSGYSLTTFYLSILETLIKRTKQTKANEPTETITDTECEHGELKEYWYVDRYAGELSRLGEVALSGLIPKSKTLIFKSENLTAKLGQQELNSILDIGLLRKVEMTGKLHEDIGFSFIHKTLQEFLASFHLWKEKSMEKFVDSEVKEIDTAVFEFSMVLIFMSGLNPEIGCLISKKFTLMASEDEQIKRFRYAFSSDSYEKVFHLYGLQLRCYDEVRGQQSIKCFNEAGQLHFSFSDIILHGKDSDRKLIRETADVLLQHADDIESLQMKFIPNDEQNGITNEELNNFLDKSASIKSVNIDGYVDGQCREFTHFSEKIKQLTTLGLHNIAIEGEILTDLFTKNTARNFKALALHYIRSSDDPNVGFEYKFPSGNTKPSRRSGYERKERMRALPTSDSHNKEDSGKPLLKDILRVLPEFEFLTTLHISYMESSEDRNILLAVAKELQVKRQLNRFGYRGSSMYNVVDEQYDTEIIEVIFTMNQLQYIFLCDIALIDEFPVFPEMLRLKKFDLQDISLNKMEWIKLAKTLSDLSNKACLVNVDLTGTDIDNESFELLKVTPRLKIKMIPT